MGAADRGLDNDAVQFAEIRRLGADLLGKLAGGGEDDGTDVAGRGAFVEARPAPTRLREVGFLGEDPLDDGDKESQGLAGASLGLGDTEMGGVR